MIQWCYFSGRRNMLLWLRSTALLCNNAINLDVGKQMQKVVQATESDNEIRVVVITGAGASFCSGADLKAVGGSVWNIADGPFGFLDLSTPLETSSGLRQWMGRHLEMEPKSPSPAN